MTSVARQIGDLYLSGNTIDLGGVPISTNTSGSISFGATVLATTTSGNTGTSISNLVSDTIKVSNISTDILTLDQQTFNYTKTTLTTSGNSFSAAISISETGQYQNIVNYGDYIYISNDYGQSWIQKEEIRNWGWIDMSDSGQYQTAQNYGGYMYISNDYGQTWTQKEEIRNWSSVYISGNGQYQLAGTWDNDGVLVLSTDYGNTWNIILDTGIWVSTAVSYSGQYQIALKRGGDIYISSDYGSTWNTTGNINSNWNDVSISSNGKYAIACTYQAGFVYVSNDYGVTWTAKTSCLYSYTSMTGDGKYQFISFDDKYIKISSDYGNTWSSPISEINTMSMVAVSKDGNYLLRCSYYWNSDVYVTQLTYNSNYSIINIDNSLQVSNNLILGSTNTATFTVSTSGNLTLSSNNLTLSSNNLTINTSGNIGINITSPRAKLDIYDGNLIVRSPNEGSTVGIFLGTPFTPDSALKAGIIARGKSAFSTSMLHFCLDNTYDNSTVYNSDISNTRMVIDSSGYIGIGTTTPSALLDVNGTLNVSGNSTFGGHLIPSTNITYDLGSSTNRWRDLYLSGNTINLGGVPISTNTTGTIAFGSTVLATTTTGNTGTSISNLSSKDISVTRYLTSRKILKNNELFFTQVESQRVWGKMNMSYDGKYRTALASIPINYISTGYVYVSSDYGQTWTQKLTNSYWTDIAVSKTGQYQVVCGYNMTNIQISSDYGETWTAKSTVDNWRTVCISGNGQYITGAPFWSDDIYVSNDYGANFTVVTITDKSQDKAYFGSSVMSENGQYQVIASYSGYIYRSTDYGVTWTTVFNSHRNFYEIDMSSDGKYISSLTYASGIIISTNYGTTWNTVTDTPTYLYGSITVSGTGKYQYYTYSNDGVNQLWGPLGGKIYYSEDYGQTWELIYDTQLVYNTIVLSKDNRYLSYNIVNGYIYNAEIPYKINLTSESFVVNNVNKVKSKLANFNQRIIPLDSGYWNVSAWSPELGIFVVLSSDGISYGLISYDSINWYTISVPALTYWGLCWNSELNLFVAATNTGTTKIVTSPDGFTWTERSAGNDDNIWNGVVWSPELKLFVTVSDSGDTNSVSTSSDGITWTASQSVDDSKSWINVCWSPELGLFVAVSYKSGTSNNIMYSNNGTTWTLATLPQNVRLWEITWASKLGLFIAVGYYNIYISSDAINWTNVSVPEYDPSSVIWIPELEVVVIGTYGNQILYSYNGINWNVIQNSGVINSEKIHWSPTLNTIISIGNKISSNENSQINGLNNTFANGSLTFNDISFNIDGQYSAVYSDTSYTVPGSGSTMVTFTCTLNLTNNGGYNYNSGFYINTVSGYSSNNYIGNVYQAQNYSFTTGLIYATPGSIINIRYDRYSYQDISNITVSFNNVQQVSKLLTSNKFIQVLDNTLASPTIGTRSNGTKILLTSEQSSVMNYAIGVGRMSDMWLSSQNQFTFYTGTTSPNLVINNAGVGIGTTSPSATLDVNGSIKASTNIISPKFKIHRIAEQRNSNFTSFDAVSGGNFNGGSCIVHLTFSGYVGSSNNTYGWNLEYSTNNGSTWNVCISGAMYYNTTNTHTPISCVGYFSPGTITVNKWRMNMGSISVDGGDYLNVQIVEYPF